MSLLQYAPPVDYPAQTLAFKEFLKGFKTFQSSSEAAATEALEGLNIDEDRSSDEYDFMDDADETNGGTTRRREPKLKYMQILQDIANREKSHVQIELDDLETVRTHYAGMVAHIAMTYNVGSSSRNLCLKEKTSNLSHLLKRMHSAMSRSSLRRLTSLCPNKRKISRKSYWICGDAHSN